MDSSTIICKDMSSFGNISIEVRVVVRVSTGVTGYVGANPGFRTS